jgi:signal transduction histidine kinase
VDRQTILIVEDYQSLRAALRALLEAEDYRVRTASNGCEALEVMEGECPDLIVSDIRMPEMNGYDFYRAVRAQQEWVSIPFIFLTVKASRDDVLKGKALGADDYLTKPLDPKDLLVTIAAQLGRADAVQAAAATEFEELREELVTVLGHELRTPLTYIRCYADLALENVSSRDEDAEAYWNGVRHGADRLTRLAEDVALLAQLGTDRALENLRTKATTRDDLGEILEVVVHQYKESAAEHGLTLRAEVEPDLPVVRLHAPLLVDALSRLVDNAIKFSLDEGKQIVVRGRRLGDEVEIAVVDEGVGIPPQKMTHLFDRFHQIEREKMEQQGMGLGLAIARRLIEMHDGEIKVESAPGEGSTFSIRLPAVEAASKDERLEES